MARTVAPELRACYERENPYTEVGVEVTAPDVGKLIRRPEEYTTAPTLVSMSPAADSLVAAPSGGVYVKPAPSTLAAFATDATDYIALKQAAQGFFGRALAWHVDPAFDRAVLRSITVNLLRVPAAGSTYFAPAVILQIWRAAAQVGEITTFDNGTPKRTPYTQWSFAPLIPGGLRAAPTTVWGPSKGNTSSTLTFDVSGYGIVIDGSREGLPSNLADGRATYYIELSTDFGTADTIRWTLNKNSGRSLAGIGSFGAVQWSKSSAADPGTLTDIDGVPNITLAIDQYNPAGGFARAVYLVDLGRVPTPGTTGRVRFERALPLGTAATLELSTAGSGGPWTAVTEGAAVALAQQTYHLRATLTPNPSKRATPILSTIGIEFRTEYDATVESIVTPLARDIAMPNCAASIGDGELRVLRLGRRDFDDLASQLGSSSPATKLEVDLFLRSKHPTVTRERWLRLDRASVDDRVPTETGERFHLFSYARILKREIPLPVETINAVYTVAAGSTATAVKLSGSLGAGVDYDGKRYYVRVRSSSVPQFAGTPVYEIAGNTGTDQLDFAAGDLPAALAAGDVIEVHSGVMQAPRLTYTDWDPAAIWRDLLENQLQIPPERIGVGYLPRGGLPPTITDRCPGSDGAALTAQAKSKVSIELSQPESGDALLDQVSRLLGGATIELDGQICFVQLYPLHDQNGDVSVPLPSARYTWDPRDYFGLSCPQGLTKRQAAVRCQYGVDLTVPEAVRAAPSFVLPTDVDAINFLTAAGSDNLGRADIPDDIARWCYNSEDGGLFLANEVATHAVRYFSTGMRIWEWATRDQFPDLHPGDVVTLVTDAYTDFDVVAQQPVIGWQAYTLVLLGVDAGGRKFRGVLPGLNLRTVRALGGQPGQDLGSALGAVTCPTIALAIEAAGFGAVPQPVVVVSFTPPDDARFDHIELTVQSADGSAGAGLSGTTSPIRIPAAWGDTLTITPFCVSRAGVVTEGTGQTIALPNPAAMARGGLWPQTVTKNQRGTGAADNGEINWGVTAAAGAPFTHPNGSVYTVPQNAETKTGLAASDTNEVGSILLAFVGSDRSRFNFTPAPEGNLDRFKWFVAARFRTGGWEYFDDAAWQAFTPNENDCIVGAARRLLVASAGIEALDLYATKRILATGVQRSATDATLMDAVTQYLENTGHLRTGIEDANSRLVELHLNKSADSAADLKRSGANATPVSVVVGQLDDNGFGTSGFGVVSASTARAVARGVEEFDVADGGAVTFSPVFNGAPLVLLARQGKALAAPNPSGVWTGGSYNPAAFTYLDLRAYNVTASACQVRARFIQYGTPTTVNREFSAPLSVTSAGSSVGPASITGTSNTDQYTCRARLTLACDTTGRTGLGTVRATIILESNDGVSGWQERYRDTKTESNESGGLTSTSYDYEITASVSGMGNTDQFRWTLVSEFVIGDATYNPGTSGATLTGNNGSNNNGKHGVTYLTTPGDVYQSITPSAGDVVHGIAMDVS